MEHHVTVTVRWLCWNILKVRVWHAWSSYKAYVYSFYSYNYRWLCLYSVRLIIKVGRCLDNSDVQCFRGNQQERLKDKVQGRDSLIC